MENPMTSTHLFVLGISGIIAVAITLCTAFYFFRNNDKLLLKIVSGNFFIIKILTVLFIVWATTWLAILGKMNEAVSAIFGAIIGYVFGSLPKTNEPKDEN